MPVTAIPVPDQRPNHTGGYGQAARLVELRLPHGDARLIQIDVAHLQLQCLGEPEASGDDQPEQRAVRERAHAALRCQLAGGMKQRLDLLVRVDMWGQPAVPSTEHAGWWYLGSHLELSVVRHERSGDLEPSCCGHRTGALDVLSRPRDLKFLGDWAHVASAVGEASEPLQLRGWCIQREAKPSPLLQVAQHRLHQGACGVHAALPGHGIATAARRDRSTLA